jgi:hypothetical protein
MELKIIDMRKLDKEQLEVVLSYTCFNKGFKKHLKEKGLIQEFKNGWYDVSDEQVDCIVYYNGEEQSNNRYGFLGGEWNDGNWLYSRESLIRDGARLMVGNEVSEVLVKEAKKRGFKEGAMIDDSNLDISNGVNYCESAISGRFHFSTHKNYMECNSGNGHIFHNGKWAEIVEEKKKEFTMQEIEDIVGCGVKIIA